VLIIAHRHGNCPILSQDKETVMPSDSGATTSFWMELAMPEHAPLAGDAQADVCVVGAGIAGLSAAYHLVREGRSVIVVDDGPIGGGETGRTTSHLSNAFDDRYHRVESQHGAEVSRLVAQSHSAAIDRIESIARDERIACDFRRVDGYLFAPREAPQEELDKELQAAHRAGLADVRRVDAPPGSTIPLGPALLFPRQGQIHPLAYLKGLAEAIVVHGGRIHGRTHAVDIEDGHPTRVTTEGGHTIEAGSTVVATNTPINDRFVIHTKQAPYRTFVVGLRVASGSVPWVQYWDTLDPYHYVRIAGRLDERHDLLIVGGEDHKTGQQDDAGERFARLVAWASERFPVLGEAIYRWSGQVMEPIDSLAFIGRNPGDNHVYVVTGDSGNGMTHGTIAGMLLTDLILGRDNPWREVYDPSRKSVKAVGEFAKENANVAAQYAEWVKPGDVKGVDDVRPGEGAVIRHHLGKLAVYRDATGAVRAFDATCPHLGCVVEWNSTERTWDCPCHGSRFDLKGEVVNGPARSGLSSADPPR
jgi:glycine/D-amino acid oxidase-like deaminating enzyme/nitrite reductase/ring-hydroxylating ferredoxin subunit